MYRGNEMRVRLVRQAVLRSVEATRVLAEAMNLSTAGVHERFHYKITFGIQNGPRLTPPESLCRRDLTTLQLRGRIWDR